MQSGAPSKRTTLMIHNNKENGSTADGDNRAQFAGGPHISVSINKGERERTCSLYSTSVIDQEMQRNVNI